MLLTEFRQQYPQYDDMDDESLARGIHKKYYSDLDFGGFSKSIGYEAPVSNVANDIVSAFQGVVNEGVQNPLINNKQSIVDYQRPPEPETLNILGTEIKTGDQFPTLNQSKNILRDITKPGWREDQLTQELDRIMPGKRKPGGMYPSDPKSELRTALEGIFGVRGEVTPTQNAEDMAQAAAQYGGKELGISGKEYLEGAGQRTGILTRVIKDVASGGVATASGMMGYASMLDEGNGLRVAQDIMDAKSEELMPANPSFGDEVAAAFGSTAIPVAPGLAVAKLVQKLNKLSPKLAAWAGAGSSGFIEATAESGGIYKELLSQGLSKNEAKAKTNEALTIFTALTAITNRFGIFNEVGGQVSRRLMGAGYEGVAQEGPQQIIGNVYTGKDWNEGVPKATAIGSIVGGALAGNMHSKKDELGAELDKTVRDTSFNPSAMDEVIRDQLNPNNQTDNNKTNGSPAEQIVNILKASIKQPESKSQFANNDMASNIVELFKQKNNNRQEAQMGETVSNGVSGQANPVKPAETAVVRQNSEELEQENQLKPPKLPELMKLQSDLQTNGYENPEELNTKLREIKVLADEVAYGENSREDYNEAVKVKKWAVEFAHEINKTETDNVRENDSAPEVQSEKVESIQSKNDATNNVEDDFEQHLKDTNRRALQWNNLPEHVRKTWATKAGLTKPQVKQVVSSKWGPIENGEVKTKLETMLDGNRDHHESLRNGEAENENASRNNSGQADKSKTALEGSVQVGDVGAKEIDKASEKIQQNNDDEVSSRDDGKLLQGVEESGGKGGSRIEDFGEKLGGARKDVWSGFREKVDTKLSDEEIIRLPLSKIFPEPDYSSLNTQGADATALATIKVMRDEIPAKGRAGHKQARYLEQVKMFQDTATKILDNPEFAKKFIDGLRETGKLKGLADRVDLMIELGFPEKKVNLKGITLKEVHFSLYKGEKNVNKWLVRNSLKGRTRFGGMGGDISATDTRKEAITALKRYLENEQANPKGKNTTKFEVYKYKREGSRGWIIGKKLGRNYIDLKEGFESSGEARVYIDDNQADLEQTLAKKKEIPAHRKPVNEARLGEDYRAGKDIDAKEFSDTFGFRGVEFGNWVEQKKRQQDINDAYDGLMDLAKLLDIPPKAISLNGELGMAFGARGKGGVDSAKAHYEPGKVVINLTKKNGAGSLGHEWFHSLDNYFSRMRGDSQSYATDRPYELMDKSVRPEMLEKFKGIVTAIKESGLPKRASVLDGKRSKDYWSTTVEMTARSFESYLISKLKEKEISNDYLANIVSPEYWRAAEALGLETEESYPYILEEEQGSINDAYDAFFKEVKTKKTKKGVALFSKEKDPEKSSILDKGDTKNELDNLVFGGKQVSELSNLNQDKVNEQQRKQEKIRGLLARRSTENVRPRGDRGRLDGSGNTGRDGALSENKSSSIQSQTRDKDSFLDEGLESPKFKEYMNGAFFVDDSGKPIYMLHGSLNKTKIEFSKDHLGLASSGAPSGLGFYTTQDKAEAVSYATNRETGETTGAIYNVVTNIKNPYIINKGSDLDVKEETVEAYTEIREALQYAGYDGIYIKGIGQIIAFESTSLKAIKSEDAKTGKILRVARGTFDKSNPNTFYSKDKNPDKSTQSESNQKAASSGLLVSEVEKIIAPVILKWGDKAPKVDVVQSIKDIPEHIIDADEHGVERVSAVHYGAEQQIYLVANKLKNKDHVLSRLAHEAVGHHSFEEIMGDDLDQVLERVQWLKRSGDKKLTAISDEVFERYGRLDKITEAKEIVALIAEKGVSAPLLTKVVAALRKFLRKLGINLKWSKGDLDALVVKAAKNLETNRTKKEKAKQFSREENERYFARDAKEILDDIDEEASKVPTYDDVKDLVKRANTKTRPGWLKMLTRRHLSDIGSDVLPTIKTYVLTAEKMDAFRNELVAESSEVAKDWTKWATQKENVKAADSMVDIMHGATIAGVDPAEPYNAVIVFLEAKEDIAKQFRFARSMPGEAGKYIEKANEIKDKIAFEKNRERAYPELKRQWDKLPAKAQEIYKEVRDHYVQRLNQTEQALMDKIDRAELSAKEKDQYKNEMRLQFESVRVEGPYFPLARFGDYWAKVLIPTEWQKKYAIRDKGFTSKDSQHGKWAVMLKETRNAIETFDSKEDAIKWAVDKSMDYEFYMFEKIGQRNNLVKKKEAQGFKVKTGHKIDKGRQEAAVSEGFVADVLKVVDKLGLQSNSTHDEIYQLFLNTLPDVSMRKSFIHRQKKEGFTHDALRAFSHHNFHGAYQLSKLKFADVMQTQIENMEEQARDMNGNKADKAAQILNETKKRHDWAMNPMGSALANSITQFNFVWYLGATPAAAVVNMTQTAMVAFPAMGAKFGFTKAGKELLNASREFMGNRIGVKDGLFSIEGALKGDELKAYQWLVDTGIIDKTLAHDLAAMSETPSAIYSPTKDKVMGVVSYAFHHAERFNREVTSIATYRLARKKGLSHKQAMQEAYNMVDATHFNYSNANKAAFMQHDIAKVAFIFKQYSLNMIYLLARSTYQSVKGESAEVKKEARKKLGGILFMSYLFVGYNGMPWLPFGLIDLILEMIWDDEDEPYDIEAERRNFLSEHLGSKWADVIAIGPAEALTGIGVSDRLALDSLWFRPSGRDLEVKEELRYQALSMLGPTFGIADNAARGVGYMREGKVYRGIELMLPKFAKDGMKAIRYADEGVTTLKGDPIIEDVNAFEVFMQSIGFSVGRANKQYDARSAIKNAEYKIKNRRKLLMNKFATATRLNDTTWKKEVLKEMATFSKKNPTNAITADSIIRSLKMRARTSAMTKNGVYLRKNMQHLRSKGSFADD